LYIKENWDQLSTNEALVASFKATPFIDIKTPTGISLKCPSELYDPRNKLFIQIFEGDAEAFPTAPFTSDSWLELLSMQLSVFRHLRFCRNSWNEEHIVL
jgi:hypothetical protein